MNDIPNGNVTFLFTDIEGSTKLAQQFPETYHAIMSEHDKILQDTIESNNGFIFKKVGDAFCSSFQNASDAIRAAYCIQKNLLAHSWSKAPIKVRIGIHSGEAKYLNNDYMGYITLSRVSRIMSVANGGQVLITKEVFNETIESLPSEITLRDLGERKLKDIILPEHIYQLVAEGLPSEFEPLKSLDVRPNNLPQQISKFIGREKELSEINKLLSGTRKLTIVGSGGTGKTRLAIRVASDLIDEFEYGVWFIELSSLTDPMLIESEIALVLNLKEETNKELIDTIKDYLKEKKLLLIFDNVEHLLEKCASISSELLQTCPKLKIISTSRESLNIGGESIYRVPPLSVPSKSADLTVENVGEYESARLFIDRASAIKNDFKVTGENLEALAELCRKLDGIPFAIELAATRVNVLPVEKILQRLTDRFKLLSQGRSTALPRHQTLRALIDWSYELLNENEKILLQRLSVFMGGCSLEAVEAICTDETIDEFEILDLLTSLESKSLINFTELNDNIRYNMLETIKQYSLEKLSDKEMLGNKYFDYYLKLSDKKDAGGQKIEQSKWLKIIEAELDNIRKSVQWSMENEPEKAFTIISMIQDFWLIKAYFKEGLQTCIKALALDSVKDKKLRAEVLLAAAEMCFGIGNFSDLKKFTDDSLSLFREIEDKNGIASCLILLGNVCYTNLEMKKAHEYYEEALKISEEIGSKELKAKSMLYMSYINQNEEKEKALKLKEEALRIFRELKDNYNAASVLAGLGIFEFQNGNTDRAMIFSEESLAIARETCDQYFISINLINLGRIYNAKKDYLKAEYSLKESLRIIDKYGYTLNLHPALIHLARIYKSKGEYIKSIQTYKEFLKGSSSSGAGFFLKPAFTDLAECYLKLEDYEETAIHIAFLKETVKRTEIKLKESEKNMLEDYEKILREKLGDSKYEEINLKGNLMTSEEAISHSIAVDTEAIPLKDSL